MALTWKMAASEILICGLKKIPIAGEAIEVVGAIQSRHEMMSHAERISELEAQISRPEKKMRDLVADEMRTILETLARPDLSGATLSDEIRNLRQIQEQGWSSNLFEGLLLNSSHRETLKKSPTMYGDLLGDRDVIRPDRDYLYMLLDVDGAQRLLEMKPAALAMLLANQTRGVPEAKIAVADGVWAFSNGTAAVAPPKPEVKEAERQARSRIISPPPPPPKPAPAPASFVNSVGMKFVRIEAGTFTMGSKERDDEKPPHKVRITRPFYLGVHPVTQGQYLDMVGQDPSHHSGAANLPVEQVSWFDAVAFCNRLSEAEKRTPCYRIDGTNVSLVAGNGYRLPTEAEWEYACRAGTTTRFPFGDNEAQLGEYAWFNGNSGGQTRPVGQKRPNAWGLHDMLGDVWEWCWDCYDEQYYQSSSIDDPTGSPSASYRVVRGGCWGLDSARCRPAYRGGDTPGSRDDDLGFRLATVQAGP